jgi:hypothetical protein
MSERNPAARLARKKAAAYAAEYQRMLSVAKLKEAMGYQYQTEVCEFSDHPEDPFGAICGKPRTKFIIDIHDPAGAPFPLCDEHFAMLSQAQMQAEAMVEAGMKPVVTLPDGEEIYDPDDVKGEN